MTGGEVRPHAYDPDPRGTTQAPPCRCGMTSSHRSHQPWWWRWLNRGGELAVSARTPAACGTPEGFARHRFHDERPCGGCRDAWDVLHPGSRSANQKTTGRRPRPRRRRRGETPPGELTPREAVALAAHRAGALVLGGDFAAEVTRP